MKLISIGILTAMLVFVVSSCGNGVEEKPVEVNESNIDSLIRQHPDSVPLLVQRGQMRFDKYLYDLALQDAAKAFRLDTNNLQARLLYAEVINNRDARTPEEVMTAQRQYNYILKKEPKNLRALVGIASTYSYQQDFNTSFEFINKALRIDKHYRNAYVLKGSNYMQLGKIDFAKSSYKTAIEQDPEFFEAYFILGQIYQEEGDPLCLQYYRSAYDLRPEFSNELRYYLAYSEQNYGDMESAKYLYRKMAGDTSDFNITRGLFHQGWIKQFIENDVDSAVYFYKSALKTEPRYVESWHNLGVCYDMLGDKTRALQSFAKALKYNPEFELSRNYADSIRFL